MTDNERKVLEVLRDRMRKIHNTPHHKWLDPTEIGKACGQSRSWALSRLTSLRYLGYVRRRDPHGDYAITARGFVALERVKP